MPLMDVMCKRQEAKMDCLIKKERKKKDGFSNKPFLQSLKVMQASRRNTTTLFGKYAV